MLQFNQASRLEDGISIQYLITACSTGLLALRERRTLLISRIVTSQLHTVDRKHFICLVEFRKTNRGRAVVAKATSGDMAPWRVLCDDQWRVSVRRFLRLPLYRTATDIYQKNLNSTEESFALWPNFFINTFHSCVYKLGEWTSIQHYLYSVYFESSDVKSWFIGNCFVSYTVV